MKTCFLFPGQGAQYPGMAKDIWEKSDSVKDLFAKASDITSKDLKGLLFDGTEEDLKSTDNTQTAITLANLSAGIYLQEKGIVPAGCAGFSLGEYSGFWQAGILDTESLFTIVKIRGEVMEEASRKLDSPQGNPGMAAVVGIGYDEVAEALAKVDEQVYIANYNSPIQIVIAGTFAGIEKAEKEMDNAGAMRYIRLKVSGPFHTPLLEGARAQFAKEIASFSYNDPKINIFSNVTGEIIRSGAEAKELCIKQVVSSVLWVKEEQNILDSGFNYILEAGPGTVLKGLWRSFNKEIKCISAGKAEEIESLV